MDMENLPAQKSNSKQNMPRKISTVSFFSLNHDDALSHLRMMGPAHHLGIKVIEGVEKGQVLLDKVLSGDVVVLQRDFPRMIESYEKILTLAHQNQIPVILDFDDFLFELPDDHPDRRNYIFTASLMPMFQAMLEVDLVTVSTSRLRDFVYKYNKNIAVLPNYLDDHIWKLKPPVRKLNQDEKIIIGYMGGLSHRSDVAILEPVIHSLIQHYPDQLEFHFWVIQPPESLISNPNIVWHDLITWNYAEFASYFQSQPVDILVAPLVDNYFNNCKSSIKYLEYGSLGVPGVFSQVEPYSDVIVPGENGFLASSTEDWINCLGLLIESPELRFTIATNAQRDIQSNRLLSMQAPGWLTAYQQAQSTKTLNTPLEAD